MSPASVQGAAARQLAALTRQHMRSAEQHARATEAARITRERLQQQRRAV